VDIMLPSFQEVAKLTRDSAASVEISRRGMVLGVHYSFRFGERMQLAPRDRLCSVVRTPARDFGASTMSLHCSQAVGDHLFDENIIAHCWIGLLLALQQHIAHMKPY